ncbi:MAG: hypothetical protein AB1331_05890 [Bacillota bacterium]
MWFAVLFVIPVAIGGTHLLNRYKYTRRSRLAMGLSYLVAFVLALAFIRYQFPGLEAVLKIVLAVVGAIPIFVVLALVVAELWRKSKQREFDSNVHRLRLTVGGLKEHHLGLERELHTIELRRRDIENQHRNALVLQSELDVRINSWRQAGGIARIRAVKAEEWEQEFGQLDEDKLQATAEVLKREAEAAEPGAGREHAEVRQAVCQLVRLRRKLQQPNAELAGLEKEEECLRQEAKALEAELERLEEELREAERALALFLADPIELD